MASFRPGQIIGLGIDTGGTFTDAAVVDITAKKVISKSKSPTTHHELIIGLEKAIDEALAISKAPPSRLNLVSVSTTLATNSILEGKGGDVGLIGIGWKPQSDWVLGGKRQAFIKGGHDPNGRPVDCLDLEEVNAAIDLVSADVDALAVSGLFSVNNPGHENEVKRMAVRRTGLPVVVGHDLTGELGIMERTITAVLNARLIPAISEFLDSVVGSLRGRGIDCPIMVAKGNGSLMRVEVARERPIETILSGPAASAVGGTFLADQKDCVVIDIGGTSTDIALLQNGLPGVSEGGTTIGGWRTRVRTADIRTCAIGGDSEIYADLYKLFLGPERVIPLCVASLDHPDLIGRMAEAGYYRFYKVNKGVANGLSSNEREVYELLRSSGPLTVFDVRAKLPEQAFVDDHLRSLTRRGLVVRIGFTPTDLLHVLGQYSRGDARPSGAALDLIAGSLAMGRERMVDTLMNMIVARISEEVLNAVLFQADRSRQETAEFRQIMDMISGARPHQCVGVRPSLGRPIIGVGAPAKAFIPLVASRLGTTVIVPDDHDVGNAVGAVTSKICESALVSIVPMNNRYHIESPLGVPISHLELDDALRNAERIASDIVTEKAKASGAAGEIKVITRVSEVKTLVGYPARESLVSVHVSATGMADPEYAVRD